jgi:hypothetical protein
MQRTLQTLRNQIALGSGGNDGIRAPDGKIGRERSGSPDARTADKRGVKRRSAASELKNARERTDPPCLEDLEAIDQLIDCFFKIALDSGEDFDRAAKAAYVVLELIDIHAELLVNVARDYRDFSFF